MPFVIIHKCIKCDYVLNRVDRMDKGGCCPNCGHISGSTICDSYTISVYKPIAKTKKNFIQKILGL
jgi:hypothetical protein